MQLSLPIFPEGTKFISDCAGIGTRDGIVTYIVNGLPIYCHSTENTQAFRFYTSNLVVQKLCKKIEIVSCFGVSYDSVNHYVKLFREKGEAAFFGPENRHGHCYKLTPPVLGRAQKYLNSGKSNSETARLIHVKEGTVRYAIKNGKLKKKV